MANQTTPIGMGRTAANRVDGHQLGLSRTGNFNAISATAYGSQVPIGRLVVFSPFHNEQIDAGQHNPSRTVALPDKTGDLIINPLTGNLLKNEAPLLAKFKVNGKYMVAGIVIEGDACDQDRCRKKPQPWPIGDHDELIELNHTQMGRALTYLTHGYARVRIGEDLREGDKLAFTDETDNIDPMVGVQALGCIVKAGSGVQDLPNTWTVVTGGKAGTSAEIFVGA